VLRCPSPTSYRPAKKKEVGEGEEGHRSAETRKRAPKHARKSEVLGGFYASKIGAEGDVLTVSTSTRQGQVAKP
jgi:hypothetical protein